MEERLFTPGPVKLPERVRTILGKQIIHHRTEEFRREFLEVRELFKKLVHNVSENFVFFSSSGTGAMESAVLNFFQENEKVIVISCGKFGERWKQLAYHWKLKVIEYNVEWGKSFKQEVLEDLIRKNPDVKGILYQISESSTGVYSDPSLIKEIVRGKDIITVADAITALGVYNLNPEEQGIDVLVGGSQKALMLPPGLSLVWFSEKAKERLTERAFYFNIKNEMKKQLEGQTAFTPAIPLIIALKESLSMLIGEGMDKIEEKYRVISRKLSTSFGKSGFQIFPEDPVISMTVVYSERADEIRKELLKRGFRIAGGQDKLKGKIFRISHMGVDIFDLVGLVYNLDIILYSLNIIPKRGLLLEYFVDGN